MVVISDRKLFLAIRYAPVALIVLLSLLIIIVVIQDNRSRALRSIESLRADVIERQKESIRQHVDLAVKEINYQKSLTRSYLKKQVKSRVEEVYSIAEHIYQINYQSKSKEEITHLISEAIRPIHFSQGRGYFFIFQMDGVNVMHGLRPELEGQNLWNSQDSRGTYILREHIGLVEEQGEAFYQWWYPKPGESSNEEFEKIGFGKLFEPYGWLIGTGEYLVDVENDIKNELLNWTSDYGYDSGSFLFIIDNDGKIISHREPNVIGRYLSNIEVASALSMQNVVSKTSDGEGAFLSYIVPKRYGDPTAAPEYRDKISYIKRVEGWNWFVGTGFYTDDFEEYLASKQVILEEQNKHEFIKVASISGLLIFVVTIFSLIVSRAISSRFTKFELRINRSFDELESTKDRMQHMALHDALTGLPNRLLLLENISNGIEHAKKHDCMLATVFVDLDDFKKVNDLYGHASGDKLLEMLSLRFQSILDPKESVSRFGGDEFIFCFPELHSNDEVRDKVHKIKNAFGEPFIIDGKVVVTDCSIGVSMYPTDSDNPEALISKADIVLYKSKATHKGDVMFYNTEINDEVQYEYLIEDELREAISEDEVFVLYQPQVDVLNERMVGVEALARWHSERLGVISPEHFIAVAENIGVIHDIGEYVFRQACSDILMVSPNGENALMLSINISPKQLLAKDFTSKILDIIADVGIDISRITLEITENVLIDDIGKIAPILRELRNLGFGLSLDDFGTGYSSLSYLNTLPISEIKIDKCFVEGMLVQEQSRTLIKAILAIGESCNLTVIAEGVEDKEQYSQLISYGCNLIQGFYVDEPLALDELVSRISTRTLD